MAAANGPVTAVVLLRSANGAVPRPEDLTAERISQQLPPPAVANRVHQYFSSAGFTAGPIVGLSFSITGDSSDFTRTFGIGPLDPGQEYPLDAVPGAIRQAIAAVASPEPIEFGPGNP